jgi:integrase
VRHALRTRQKLNTSHGRVDPLNISPVFAAQKGGWRDPSNTNADLRDAFAFAGDQGLTSHTLRKSVATLMDAAGLSARQAADQLGHSDIGVTQARYYGRKVAKTGAAQLGRWL